MTARQKRTMPYKEHTARFMPSISTRAKQRNYFQNSGQTGTLFTGDNEMTIPEKPKREQEPGASSQQGETETRTLPSDYWEGELVPPSDPRAATISVNPERMSGTPCFVGTRVPIKNLWDYLEASNTLEEFLEDFEGVPREEVMAALRQSYQRLLDGLPEVAWKK